MFQNLINLDPDIVFDDDSAVALDKAAPTTLIDAQATTADWLSALGAEDDAVVEQGIAAERAREAFTAVTTLAADDDQRTKLLALKTPPAVRHLVGMLTAYDWEFVEQAKQLRGYTVAQIVELTKSSNENMRLKALALLGKVTEVGLFTDKIEVSKKDLTDAELDQRIKEKLNKFMGVIDVVAHDVEDAAAGSPAPATGPAP